MKIYKVGGYVRDKLLGIDSKDIDYLVVGATKDEMLLKGFIPVGKSFPVYLHPKTKSEYALARKEVKTGLGHTAFDFDSSADVSLEDDLLRRDFTINAIAEDEAGKLYDFHNGIPDVGNKVLRHISSHFAEDPLRVLRAARFTSQLEGFVIHEDTLKLIKSIPLSEYSELSGERVFMELKKALNSNKPSQFFRSLNQMDLLNVFFPEVYSLIGQTQPLKYHPEGDAFNHTMDTIDFAKKQNYVFMEIFAMLVHDFGKGLTPKDELPKHRNHEGKGALLVAEFCSRLKVSNEIKTFALTFTENHMFAHKISELRAKTLLKLMDRLGVRHDRFLDNFIRCSIADSSSRNITNKEIKSSDNENLKILNSAAKVYREMDFSAVIKGIDDKSKIKEFIREYAISELEKALKS